MAFGKQYRVFYFESTKHNVLQTLQGGREKMKEADIPSAGMQFPAQSINKQWPKKEMKTIFLFGLCHVNVPK